MKRLLLVRFVFLILCTSWVSQVSGQCISQLPTFIEELIKSEEYKPFDWGILIQSPSSSKIYYAHSPDTFFTPASNNKVITSSTLFLLSNYTQGFKFSTPILLQQQQTQQTQRAQRAQQVAPSLCIQGRGDASMNYSTLEGIADKLVNEFGIRRLHTIVLDQSYFHGDGQPFPTSWEWEDLQADYGGQPQALIMNENAVTVTVSPTAVGQPVKISFNSVAEAATVRYVNNARTLSAGTTSTLNAFYPLGSTTLTLEGGLTTTAAPVVLSLGVINTTYHFLSMLQYALKQKGIVVDVVEGAESVCESSAGWKNAFDVESPPLAQLMNYTLQTSNNLYAEIFLRTVGAQYTLKGNSTGSTMYDGIAMVQKTLKDAGVDASTFKQADGSGLSRHNMVSPRALIEILTMLYYLPDRKGELFKSFLPLGGKTGTLRHRFIGTPAEGKVRAKTGSETGVNSLSGYVENKNFDSGNILFSIIVNGNPYGSAAALKAIDQIVVYLAKALNC